MMKITFELTEKDYFEFVMFTMNNYQFYRKQKKLFRVIFTIIPAGVGLTDMLIKRWNSTFILGFLIVSIPLSVLFWFFFPKFVDALTLMNAKKILSKEGMNGIIGEKTFFFEEDGIRLLAQHEENSMGYERVIKTEQTADAVYLYTSSANALIVPLRIFSDEEAKKEFLAFLHTKFVK